jgi:hypothetical protein
MKNYPDEISFAMKDIFSSTALYQLLEQDQIQKVQNNSFFKVRYPKIHFKM